MCHFVSYLTQTCATVCAVPDKLLETSKFDRGGVRKGNICTILIEGFLTFDLIDGDRWRPLLEPMKRNTHTISWVIYNMYVYIYIYILYSI